MMKPEEMSLKELKKKIEKLQKSKKIEDAQELISLKAEYSYRIYWK